jgi:phenylacetate-coenzyme A ligase PaaK-like adenylate-forming protein
MNFRWEFSPDYYRRSLDILEVSLGQIPAYKSWQVYDPGPESPVDERYAAMPALYKTDIKKYFPDGFTPPGHDVELGLANKEIDLASTSGSSDISVTNIWNQNWWNASEKASWKLNSYASRIATGTHAEAILVNPLNVGFVSDDVDLPMERRRLSRFLYLNEKTDPAKWTPELMDRMLSELEVFKPAVLEANPSFLAKLCRYAKEHKKKVYQPGLIVFTYEYPTRFHYRQIRQVFDVPMASSYGSTETGYVFMQCEEGKFHQNSEFCRVDFQPLQSEQGGPRLGRILVTTFNNPWYYMVRFDVRDLVRIDEEGECPCGRNSGYILSAIEGRAISLTLTCEGRLVTLRELDNTMSALDGVDEYRLEQVASGEYDLYLVSQRKDKSRLTREASEMLTELYGKEAKVSVIYEDALSPEDSGKYAIAKALFPIDLEDYLDERCVPEKNGV